MWKKTLLAAVALMIAGVLVFAAAAATSADDGKNVKPGGPVGGPFNVKVVERAAQILGIDQQKLADAFKQAEKELAQKNMDDLFARWVSDGKLTQAQADQYKTWLNARPADMPPLAFMDASKATEALDRLLKDSRITQAQYDACKAWLAQKPAFELPKPDRPPRTDNSTPRQRPDMPACK